MNRTGRQMGAFPLQQLAQLTRSPIWSGPSQFHHSLLGLFFGSPRTVMRTPTSLLHATQPIGLVPVPPGVTGPAGNLELLTEFCEALFFPAGCDHKLHSLFGHFGCSPRHPRPLPPGLSCTPALALLGLECKGCLENAL